MRHNNSRKKTFADTVGLPEFVFTGAMCTETTLGQAAWEGAGADPMRCTRPKPKPATLETYAKP